MVHVYMMTYCRLALESRLTHLLGAHLYCDDDLTYHRLALETRRSTYGSTYYVETRRSTMVQPIMSCLRSPSFVNVSTSVCSNMRYHHGAVFIVCWSTPFVSSYPTLQTCLRTITTCAQLDSHTRPRAINTCAAATTHGFIFSIWSPFTDLTQMRSQLDSGFIVHH
jgi:hypothetical protein